ISTYCSQRCTKLPTKISSYHINKQQKSLLPILISPFVWCVGKRWGAMFFNLLPITFVSAYFDLPFSNLKVWYDASLLGFHILTVATNASNGAAKQPHQPSPLCFSKFFQLDGVPSMLSPSCVIRK
ncbi:hypothetical protein S83_058611, partial [Arachis hypogaea]